ncbi:enoyl-CoA hydratase/isomerase family protein [Balneola sp. MJW-20]|uniref:enoyl-CoA hydratase/isomerase family protein n=1 Tax=Gracilimonas aurantiaca TaxID=3234185 RepID=UPI003467C80E
MDVTYETLLLEVNEAGICRLTINRPDKMNALNSQVLDELDQAIDQIEVDADIKGLIITGTGEKAFVAGADIKELSSLDEETGKDVSRKGQDIFQRIEDLDIPVIAAVNGYALGGGCELALSCQIRIADQNAVMGLPEVSLGLIPGYGGTQRLTETVGKAKALELIMTGRFVKADEAEKIGLVNSVSEGSALEDAEKMMAAIQKQGPLAVRNAILAVNQAGKESGYKSEAKLFGELCATDDFKEGTGAFLEKRKPDFSGK